MSSRTNKTHSALKHGGYSARTILPGENRAEFEALHLSLMAELVPNGTLEEKIVAEIARLVWRKENLATFRLAELGRNYCEKLTAEKVASFSPLMADSLYRLERETIDRAADCEKARRESMDQARQDLGDAFELVEIGDTATLDRLKTELEVEDRMDAMIDKCLKRLLYLRGLKSISPLPASAPLLISAPPISISPVPSPPPLPPVSKPPISIAPVPPPPALPPMPKPPIAG